MAWARGEGSGKNVEVRVKRTASATRNGASRCDVATTAEQRGHDGVGANENDNYSGGDDNYPRVVLETGPKDERKDVAATGKNSCR
jgi:hypothetical protein